MTLLSPRCLSVAGRGEGTQTPSPRPTPRFEENRSTECRSLIDHQTRQRRFAPMVIGMIQES